MFAMDEQTSPPLNRLMSRLTPGQLVDSAWLHEQGISRSSVHAYVKNHWLERVAPRVYRRSEASSSTLRWDLAVASAQALRPSNFYVGGPSALDLLGRAHYLSLGGASKVHLYDPEGNMPSWLVRLPLDAVLLVRTRALFTDPALGVEWRRYELGTGRLGSAVDEPSRSDPWDNFLKVAGEERAAIEMLDEVPEDVAFDFADEIFQGLSNLRPRLVTRLLASCASVRAKRLFLFYADRHDHAWSKHVDRTQVDLGKGKRQLVAGGRLDTRYQITVPLSLSASREDGA